MSIEVKTSPDDPETELPKDPESRHLQGQSACRKRADTVAKVENRSALKISRKLIFGCLRDCVSFQRRCRWEDPWSILDETIWSPTSPHARCISGSKNFRSSPQKDFCNNICQKQTCARRGAPIALGQLRGG